MMKFKSSIFNMVVPENNSAKDYYVFNTLTRNLLRIDRILNDESISVMSYEDLEKLKLWGFIVDKDLDEIDRFHTQMDLKRYEQKRLYVTIIPTNACNFKCIYCYQPSKTEIMKEETVEKVLKWFEKNLRFYAELSLSWFGGEPLLCKEIMFSLMQQISEMCKKYGVSLVSSATTNGYLLDIESFIRLHSYGLMYYQITVDGDEVTHNNQRPHKLNNDSYSRIIQNLTQIASLPQHYRFEIGIRINISGSMSNESIMKFVDKMAELFSGDKRFVIVWQWVRDWGGDRINTHDKNRLVQTSDACGRYIDYARTRGLRIAELISTITGTDSCEAYFKNGYVFNFDGKVHKCAMCLDDEDNNCIGEINNHGVMKIDETKELRWLSHGTITGKCKECVYLPICYSNRCHYSIRIKGHSECIQYKNLIFPQIDQMIENHKYKEL